MYVRWVLIEFAGCPKELVAMIKAMYERSTISIGITSDGDLAPEFAQKRGIRQGSSLSPCLFILAMDFCLRVFQDSCKELGLPSHDQTWCAYADDIADKAVTEEEASSALQELEAASAFVGLRLNVAKTESMAKGIKKAESVKAPFKELVEVSYDDGVFRGWKTEARWAELIGVKDLSPEQKTAESSIVIIFDGDKEEDRVLAEERGGGWIRDQEGDTHRMKKLGYITKNCIIKMRFYQIH